MAKPKVTESVRFVERHIARPVALFYFRRAVMQGTCLYNLRLRPFVRACQWAEDRYMREKTS